jgi:hypothetical protein
MIQIVYIAILLSLLYRFWPIFLAIGIAYFFFRSWKWHRAPDPHIGYVVIKDGLGKFGITRKNGKTAILAIKKRYNSQPLEVLWTGKFRDREAAFNFERYCKSQVRHIVKGREWISVEEARWLARRLGG